MANFCYDCTKDILGVDPTWNDFAGWEGVGGYVKPKPEDGLWKVLCEGCGVIVVDSKGKKVDDIPSIQWYNSIFSERIDEDE